MALTQSARLPGWDEEVVPALRKRLEGESRILSRRISAAVSISSMEETEPRPSFQRTSSERPDKPNGAPTKRSRTYSTPKLSEIPSNKSRSPDPSSRAQYSDPKPTRIPKATRPRAGSITANGNANGRHSPYNSPSAEPPRRGNQGLLPPAALTEKPSQETIHIPMKASPGLLHEPAPFVYGSESTTSHDEAPPRPSNDSEERPFEHWYRGEVSRNGGVGELKMGKRAEMLEIANYGHTLKQKQALAAAREAEPSTPRRRKRSDSADPYRESLYLDEEHAANVGRVLDEGPLTDVDAEMSDVDYHNQHAADDHYRTTTPTPATFRQQAPPTRIPGPSAPSPPQPQNQRGASEPPTFPTSPSSLSQSSRQLQNPKRAAAASPTASTSASKKPRAAVTPKPKAKAKPKRANTVADEKNRRSVAYYPSPGSGDEEDMADAIPTWTQPVTPSTGRWDDVVLPVVARKKGLEGLYEHADGSPKPRKVEEPIAPAPGTFGWDHSKYRPPRNDLEMDEFGQPRPRPVEPRAENGGEEDAPGEFGGPLYPPTAHDQQRVGPQGTRGEAPRGAEQQQRAAAARRHRPGGGEGEQQQQQQQAEAEDDSGCCKCVVM
ncbi:hypothetical protein C8J57DRAFT_1191713 [Mycena rebaudengoi]|nr:hypothetical protein C8J57DRAFT_1191713 [Mycena rebaudengoi]